jgi:uncharacterized membrane protein YfhO
VTFAFESDRNGWLVFHQPFDPKWRLRINGQEGKIHRANLAFMATPINKGAVEVELEYRPDTYLRGLLALSLTLSIGVIGGGIVVGARRP